LLRKLGRTSPDTSLLRLHFKSKMPLVKSRQSRMIDSSVNAPAKKDGAGGSYTWGSAVNNPTDFIPLSSEVVGPSITTTAAPAATIVVQAEPFELDDSQFPSLSGKSMALDAQVTPASSVPKVILAADHLRPGTADLFGSSHPRNTFASKPAKSTPAGVQTAGLQMAIDWSDCGIPLEVNRSLIKAGTSSHLGLYQQASTDRVPKEYLRPATAAVQETRSHRIQAQGRPQMVKQMHAKGSRGQR